MMNKIGNGEFADPGAIVLGFDLDSKNILSFRVRKISHEHIFCALGIWKFDPVNLDVEELINFVPVFSKSGILILDPKFINLKVVEIPDNFIKYIVIDYSDSNTERFIYLSLINQDLEHNYHFGFPTKWSTFNFDPNVSIFCNCTECTFSLVLNCLSSIVLLTFINGAELHQYQFDVEQYIARLLKDNSKNLQEYEIHIISKDEPNESIILLLQFIFYHDKQDKWIISHYIISLSVLGKGSKHLFSDFKRYQIRPRDTVIKNEFNDFYYNYSLLGRDPKYQKNNFKILDNIRGFKDPDGIRLIKSFTHNLVIADTRMGSLKID